MQVHAAFDEVYTASNLPPPTSELFIAAGMALASRAVRAGATPLAIGKIFARAVQHAASLGHVST